MQNDLRAGIEVVPPMANAMKSVMDVIVIDTPECLITSEISSSICANLSFVFIALLVFI